ncbi:MAG: RDD family protein [Bdellovibrionales bacterium]|jgi:uncharacterized RDD family membrane protein YckC|nr:RDD family protein [Bdellovibrionales bacterium]MBT3526057.1 RDD family protein [Bdellovibrionales bacterium]MBT7669974.1 RDD family protein [Bdellovibrionales bacterium]MBT7766715.1 RDD family protein [Bdellovibrionales bacterium]
MEVNDNQVQDNLDDQVGLQSAKAIFSGVDFDQLLDDRLGDTPSKQQEEDLFDPQFKPLTKGLGFNRENSHQIRPSMGASRRVGAATQVKNNRLQLEVEESQLDHGNKKPLLDQRLGLRAFYHEDQDQVVKSNSSTSPKLDSQQAESEKKSCHISKGEIRPIKRAALFQQLVAWWIDIVAVLTLTVVTLQLSFLLVGVSASFLLSILSIEEVLLHLGTFLSIFYLFYFTFLDTRRTLGKLLMRCYLLSHGNSRISLGQSFIRSLVSLISIFLLGLPLLMDFQGKLSTTKLVR